MESSQSTSCPIIFSPALFVTVSDGESYLGSNLRARTSGLDTHTVSRQFWGAAEPVLYTVEGEASSAIYNLNAERGFKIGDSF